MNNWKTTLIGGIMAVCIAVEPIISTGTVNWKSVGMAAMIALIGYVAQDGKKTPPTDQAK